MDIYISSKRKLSHNKLQNLIKYDFKENQKEYFVNLILQIYDCVPILNEEYFSCSLFDDEYICKKFIIKSAQNGRPYKGDIVSITKIKINILDDGNLLYYCDEIKILEKGANFLINLNDLKNISSKLKDTKKGNNELKILEKKDKNANLKENKKINHNNINKKTLLNEVSNNNNDIGCIKKEIIEINKEKEEKKIEIFDESIDLNIFNDLELFDEKKEENDSNIEANKKIEIIQTNNNNLKKENFNRQSKNYIKIEPHKKEITLTSKDKELLDYSYKIFSDEFKEQNKSLNTKNKFPIPFTKQGKYDKKEEAKKTQIQKKDNNKPKTKKNLKSSFIREISGGINIKYIEDVKRYLLNNNIDKDFKVRLKCRVKDFFHSNKNFYNGCSECHKKIKDTKICKCKNAYEQYLYFFHINVRDASGVVSIYLYNKEAEKFLGMDANTYKKLTENESIHDNNNDFDGQEYLFTIKFEKSKYKDSRKEYQYIVTTFEKISKSHMHQLMKELKSMLIIKK